MHQYKGGHFFRSCRMSKMRGALYDSFFVHPATDVIEKPNYYELHSDIPGFTKDQIKIELRDNQTLNLQGILPDSEKKAIEEATAAEEFKSSWVLDDAKWPTERFRESFSRSFYFPEPIDGDAIQAVYENGVLKVTVPKKESAKIKIN
ncbi:HSP20-like chaperone [Backusella circina FSU 941]|nr:HSP20-like chaperone [Backusella circina FSU 941]